MAFGSTSFDHLSTPDSYSFGPTAAPGEVFFTSLRRGLERDSAFGMQVNLGNAYRESVGRANQALGKSLTPAWMQGAFGTYPLILDGITAGMQRKAGVAIDTGTLDKSTLDTYLADIDRIDAELAEARKIDPKIKTFSELYDFELLNRQKIYEDSVSAMARSNGFGLEVGIESFAASALAGLNFERNPLFFASMFIGAGPAASVLNKIVTEGVIGAAAMGAQDIAFATPTARMLGEEEPDLFNDLLMGFVFSAGLRGVFEGASPAYRAAEARISPERARARVVAEGLSGEPNFGALRLSDEELLKAAQLLRDTPEKVAAEAGVINDINTKATVPDTSREGLINASVSAQQALDTLEQARPMNPKSVLFPEGVSAEQVLADILDNSPELQARVAELDARVGEAQTRLDIALEQQQMFKEGKAPEGSPTFDQQIEQTRARFDEQLAELETVRKESRVSPNNPKIVAERARIEKQAKDELMHIGSVRFMTDRMLRDEVAKARRDIRDQGRQKQKLMDSLGVQAKVKDSQQGKVRVTDTTNLDKAAKAEEVPTETKVEAPVKKMEESVKAKPEDRLPPKLSDADIEKLPPTKQTVELQWNAMNKLDLIREVEAGAAIGISPRQISMASKAMKAIPEEEVIGSREGMVKAVFNKLKIPDAERDPTAFAKWRGDYILRTAPTGFEVRTRAKEILKEQGLLEQFQLSLKGTADKPMMELRGREVPVDLEVPGPDSSRTAIQAFDEIQDEAALRRESRRCGLGETGDAE